MYEGFLVYDHEAPISTRVGVDGEFHGWGKLCRYDDLLVYEGEWKDGNANG